MESIVLVYTTVPSQADAEFLATLIVEQKLAACVNIVPAVTSIYAWQGRIERTGEVLLLIKTTANQTAALVPFIKGHHQYQVPAISVIPVHDGLPEYLAWVAESCRV